MRLIWCKVISIFLCIVILSGCDYNPMLMSSEGSEYSGPSDGKKSLASSSILSSSSQQVDADLSGSIFNDVVELSPENAQSVFDLFCYFLVHGAALTEELLNDLSAQLDDNVGAGFKIIYKSYQKSVFAGADMDIVSTKAIQVLSADSTKVELFCLTLNVKKSNNMHLAEGKQVWYIEISEIPWEENHLGPTSFMTEEKYNRVQSVVGYDAVCTQIASLLSMRSSPQFFIDVYEMDKSLLFEYIIISVPDLKEYLNGQPIPEALFTKASQKCINEDIDFTSLKNYDPTNNTYSFSPYGGHFYKYHFVGAIKEGDIVEIDVELEELFTSITYQTLRYAFNCSSDFPVLISCQEIETTANGQQ